MDFKRLKENWNQFGETDPMWSILTVPGKEGNRWDIEEFYATGLEDVAIVLSEIESHGLEIKRGRALDFGCGVGRLTFPLARQFERADGVDVAASMIEIARSQGERGPNAVFHLNERPDLKIFADNSFDFILTLIVLQHLEPRYSSAYIREFVRVLKPGGVLVFQLPDMRPDVQAHSAEVSGAPLSPYRRFRRMFRFLRRLAPPRQAGPAGSEKSSEPVMEMYGIAKAEVEQLIEQAGARVVHSRKDLSGGEVWPGWRYFVLKS